MTLARGHWIDDWDPENEAFWEPTGHKIARKNLGWSMFAEHIGFSICVLWTIVVLNLGVAVCQLLVPLAIIVGIPAAAVKLPIHNVHMAYAGLIWLPLIALASFGAWRYMDSLTQAKADTTSYVAALRNGQTWIMSFL